MRITVRVRPGASRTTVGGRYGESDPPVLIVHVQARAVDGRANEALIGALAAAFGVRASDVDIVSGAAVRTKVVDINFPDRETLRRRLAELLHA